MSTNKDLLSLRRQALLCGAAIAAFALPGVAAAQSQPPATPAPADTSADSTDVTNSADIVVTARYRKERLIDIPLAVTALKGEDLANQGVRNLREISYLTPGVTINSAGGEAYTSPVIRGLVNLNGGASDPNVAVFLDGVYLVNNSAISIGLIDIDRVEIVKGPVGSLYGHNGFAGAINYITKTPGDKFTGYGNATVGNDGQLLFTGNLSGPVIPGVLSLGLAGGYEEYDGGYRDAVNGLRSGGYKKRDFHATFALTPTENVKLTGGFYYGKDHFDTVSLVYAVDNCGPLGGSVALGESAFTQYCGKLNFRPPEVSAVKPAAGAAGNDREVYNANLRFEANLGFATFSLLGGYNNVKQQRFEDFLGRRNNLLFAVAPAPSPVAATELFGGDSNNKDYSVEARLTSDQAQAFRWAVGAYYYRNDFTTSTLIGIDKTPLGAGQAFTGTAALFATSAGQFSTSNLTLVNGIDKQTSVFGSVDIDVVKNFTVNGEIRYTHQEKSQDIIRNAFVANTVRPFGPARSGSDNFVNFRVSAKYKITSDVNAYASVATGTKAFGFNSRATAFPGEVSFGPEYATAYEVGLKTNLIERTLVLNTAAYLIDTRNLQVAVPSSDPTNTGTVTKNLGKTRTKGFEIEAVATPASWFRFNVGVGYVDAKFRGGAKDFGSAASCAAIPSCAPRVQSTTNVNGGIVKYVLLDGLQVLRVSPWTVSAGLDLNASLGGSLKWFGHADFRFEDKQYMAANNYSYWGDRTVLNLRTGVTYDAIRFTLFVDNLTKNMTVESASANTRLNDFQANPVGFLPTARRYGASIGYSF